MELTPIYIASQVFTILMYILLATTYYVKERKKVLIINFLATISIGLAYILLDAWTGFAMCIVGIVRNIIFILDEKKNGKRENINKTDIIILVVLYSISIISVIFTYDGIFSLLSVAATMLYTYSVWQKDIKRYKLLGMPTGILWILYNTYIMSIFGIVLESVLLICSVIGYILEKRKK